MLLDILPDEYSNLHVDTEVPAKLHRESCKLSVDAAQVVVIVANNQQAFVWDGCLDRLGICNIAG